MSKQDRVAPRTAADIERKYNFGQTFAEFADLIDDAQAAADNANKAVSNLDNKLDQTEVFNRLTNNGALPGLFMLDGQLYINADYLATGVISSKSGTIAVDLSGDTFKVNMSNTKSMEFGASGLFGILDGTQVLSLFQSVWASVPTAGIFSLNGADLQIDATASDESAAGKVKLASSGTTLQIKGKTVSWKSNGDGTYTLIGS